MTTRCNNVPAVWGMVLDVNLDFPDVDQHRCVFIVPVSNRLLSSHDISNDVANQNM